jgi:uncharacterized protein (DUF1697 family)
VTATTQIALLRGVNVGGYAKVAMADLRALLAALEFGAPRSLLQSGNLVFQSRGETGASLEALLEREAERRLGLRTSFLVRSAAEWVRVVEANPFPEEATRDPAHLLVMCLKQRAAKTKVESLRSVITGPERLEAHGCELYLVYPAGVGNSRLTNVLIERTLETKGTARNWNTVLKLHALAGA